jgi:hypothetical protein
MKQLLSTTMAVLIAISALAQDKPVQADKKGVNTIYYINYVKADKSKVDKLQGSNIATINIVKGNRPGVEQETGKKNEVVYIVTKDFAAKEKAKKVTATE